MPQCFVCSEAKYTHRWEPTGHQMTCSGVVEWSALGLRGKEKRTGAPGARCPPKVYSVLVGRHDALICSALKCQDSEKRDCVRDTPVFMLHCCSG